MIIDFHVHLDIYNNYADDLLRRMDVLGLDKIVIFDVDNNAVLKTVKQHSDRFIGFVFLHPLYDNAIEELKYFLDEGFRGVKMSPSGDYPEHYYPNDPNAYPVYEAIASYGVPLLYHSGVIFWDPSNPARAKTKYCLPIFFDDVARDIPNLKLVLAHGGRPLIDQTLALSVCPNVYIDLTWSIAPISAWPQATRRLLEEFGPNRLIYGSDTTGNTPDELNRHYLFARHMLENDLRLDISSINQILGENARTLLDIPPKPFGIITIGADNPGARNAAKHPW